MTLDLWGFPNENPGCIQSSALTNTCNPLIRQQMNEHHTAEIKTEHYVQ